MISRCGESRHQVAGLVVVASNVCTEDLELLVRPPKWDADQPVMCRLTLLPPKESIENGPLRPKLARSVLSDRTTGFLRPYSSEPSKWGGRSASCTRIGQHTGSPRSSNNLRTFALRSLSPLLHTSSTGSTRANTESKPFEPR
jgi:hypothetical protein